MPNPFESILVKRPGRSKFDMSYSKILTFDMGQIIPIACEEVLPSDIWQVANSIVIRWNPLVGPILHNIWVRVGWWFVPTRLLFDDPQDWENIIGGGVTGDDATPIPVWTPTGGNVTNDDGSVVADNGVGSLWDYLGLPTGVIPAGALPVRFGKRAYNKIWNDYLRDQTQMAEVDLDDAKVHQVCWRKDYLTSALPYQQRGTAPGLPVTVTGSAHWADTEIIAAALAGGDENSMGFAATTDPRLRIANDDVDRLTNARAFFNANTLQTSVVGFDINDLRETAAIQRMMELAARSGARYVEQLQAVWGVRPQDARLQRAEYIGGFRTPVIISEVLQTSETTTGAGGSPLGTLGGHGLSADRSGVGYYRAQEHGYLVGLMWVIPDAVYTHGVDRMWLKESKYDYYHPLLDHLSEQPIRKGEVFATGVEADNEATWGWQGHWDHYRTRRSMVCGKMRDDLDFWHLARQFAALPALNADFLRCIPDKRILAVPTEPAMVANIHNNLFATRPMSAVAEPGFMDQ